MVVRWPALYRKLNCRRACLAGFLGAAGYSCSLDLGTGALTCVPAGENLDAAVLREQGLRVIAPAGARGAAEAALLPASGATTFIQSQLYDDASYGGAFFQTTNANACNGSTTYSFSNLAIKGWSGRVSSFRSYSNCTTKVWQGTTENGASYGYNVNAASLGAMNDQANSVSMK
jgi:hypothetical protein